jgi:hypothetical protein|tara:strand:- start:125 stop:496 length:372 start_codon:yes stop_codon:yes gene_type:complete
MAKVRLIKIASDFKLEFDKLLQLAQSKLSQEMLTGRGKNTWIDEEGQSILMESMYIEEIVPKHYRGKVVSTAPNPSYVFAYIKELTMKVPVIVPRRYRNTMKGKTITIEMIEDVRGKSYRYVK